MTRTAELVAEATLRQAAGGDRFAQQEVLHGIYDFVRRTLFRLLLGRAEDLEDLHQAVLLRVLTSLPSFRFEASFATWVTAISINVFRDHLRRRQREPKLQAGIDSDALPAHSEPGPQQRVETRQALNDCARILEGMPERQRTAFVLQAIEGHSVAEIAALMDSAHSTTRLRLYYARKAFRRGALASQAGALVAVHAAREGNDGTA